MTKVQQSWPVVLSGGCLVVAAYFTLTDTAYRMSGCPSEVYPEAGFLLLVGPTAFIALLLAITGMGAKARSRLRRVSVSGSVLLSAVCIGFTLLSIWPTGSSCS